MKKSFFLMRFKKRMRIILLAVSVMASALVVQGGQTEEQAEIAASAMRIETNRKGIGTITVLNGSGGPLDGTTIQVEQQEHDFLFGCNIYGFNYFPDSARNAIYKQRFDSLFNYATAKLYWCGYERTQGSPDTASTNRIVAWCSSRGIKLKGHPILWGTAAGFPGYTNCSRLPTALEQKQRINELLTWYKDKITIWDVVNEPTHFSSIPIDSPHVWAHTSDSSAKLVVNDYSVMYNMRPALWNMLNTASQQGVPWDAVGIQAHEPRTRAFPLDYVRGVLDWYDSLHKEVHITEFTPVSIDTPLSGATWRGARWNPQVQAKYAADFYRVCFAHPAVTAITWWDLCDSMSWLRGGGLLDSHLLPKPAYDSLCRLIRTVWHTDTTVLSGVSGDANFKGFYGTYRVIATKGGTSCTASVHLEKGKQNQFIIYLTSTNTERGQMPGAGSNLAINNCIVSGSDALFFLRLASNAGFTMNVYDLKGRKVWSHRSGAAIAGELELLWDFKKQVATGIYFACLLQNNKYAGKKMVVVR